MDHRQQLVDLAARCRLATDVEALVVDFLTLIRCFGFAAAAAGGWIGAGRTLAYRFYFNDWPPSWAEFYSSNDVFLDDPLVNETQQRISPFLWTEIEEMSDRHRNVIRMAGDYGWSNGFVVPVHGPAGYHGMISLAAMQPLDLAQDDRVLLWTASLAVHDRCRTSPNLGQNASHVPQLSAREVECFRWVTAGKTDAEIGQLLGISRSTAHFHVERVKQRLDVRTRAQAAALLVLYGIL